jgi:hypothetical protein
VLTAAAPTLLRQAPSGHGEPANEAAAPGANRPRGTGASSRRIRGVRASSRRRPLLGDRSGRSLLGPRRRASNGVAVHMHAVDDHAGRVRVRDCRFLLADRASRRRDVVDCWLSSKAVTGSAAPLAAGRRGKRAPQPCLPRKARPVCAKGADLLSNFAGLRVRSAKSGTARPAFVKTRYSGLTGHDDGHHGDGDGLAVGENGVSRTARAKSCVRVATGIQLRHGLLMPASAAALPEAGDRERSGRGRAGITIGCRWSHCSRESPNS